MSLAIRIGDQPVALAGKFHEAWLALAERGRRPVVEAMARRLCREQPAGAVRVDLRCGTLAGPRVVADGSRDFCIVGEL